MTTTQSTSDSTPEPVEETEELGEGQRLFLALQAGIDAYYGR